MLARATLISLILTLISVSCRPTRPVHAVVVIDQSGSVRSIGGAIAGVTEQCTRLPCIQKKSTITFMLTGTPQTADEPLLVGAYPILKSRNVMEGPSRTNDNEELFQKVGVISNSIANTAPTSPLHLALLRGVQQLRVAGCGRGQDAAHCRLIGITDGEESEEPVIRKALHSNGEFKPPADLIIDNAGIEVQLCGLSQTTGNTPPRNAIGAARVEAVWKAIFSDPASVSFEPFCPNRRQEEKHDNP